MLRASCIAILALAASCGDGSLAVANVTLPDIGQVFSTPSSIEQTIGSGFQSCQNAVGRAFTGAVLPQLAVLSLEGYGNNGNYGMASRVGIPRTSITNATGTTADETYGAIAVGGRLAANAVTALDQLRSRGGTLGTVGQDLRARAFGFFAVGCHQGWLALTYDSAGIVTPGLAGDFVPPLSGAASVIRSAIAMFDSAIAVASNPAALGPSGFPLPALWTGNALTRDDFVRLVRSFRARFRAGVARTPAERAAVRWDSVLVDADNGITSDFMVTVGGTTGWQAAVLVNTNSTLFYQMSPMYYGMADVSRGYDAWLATPIGQRGSFLIVTPDRRWPQGTTRAAQEAASLTPTSITSRPYVASRPDPPGGDPWGVSQYELRRLQYLRANNGSGLFPAITKAEIDLLAAEGYLRTGNVAAAATRIDITRVGRGQLPALSGIATSLSDTVPGGASCVPRVPAAPAFTSTKCGTVFEALKWEKRMETAFTGFGQWFFDSRGWGDLVENTALELPVPYQEIVARRQAFYSLGGGLARSAPKGTYGF